MCCGYKLLWLWCRPATAALIGPLNLEIPICHRYSPKKKKKKYKPIYNIDILFNVKYIICIDYIGILLYHKFIFEIF